jgi:hypothetical protein
MKISRTLDALHTAANRTTDAMGQFSQSESAVGELATDLKPELAGVIAAVRSAAYAHTQAADEVAELARETTIAVWCMVTLASCAVVWWMWRK